MLSTKYTREELIASHTSKFAELEAKLRKDIADNARNLALANALPEYPYYGLIGTHGYNNTMRINIRIENRDQIAEAMAVLPPVTMMKWKRNRVTSFLPYDLIGEENIQDSEQDISSCAPFYFDRWFESAVIWYTNVEGVGLCTVVAEMSADRAHSMDIRTNGRVDRVVIMGMPNGNMINYGSTPGEKPHNLVWFHLGSGSAVDQWNAVKDTEYQPYRGTMQR